MSECWRCEGVVLYQRGHEFTHYCVMDHKNLKQKMLPSPHSLHYWAFFQHDNDDIHSPQGENPSMDIYFTQSYRSWAAVGDSVETSGAKLPFKDQSIQGGRPPGVKQDRCELVHSVPRRVSSQVLEDMPSTRILYICWIKSREDSFLQSFI